MTSLWWFSNSNQLRTSLSEAELREKLKTNNIAAQSLVWRQGMARWESATQFEKLVQRFQQKEPNTPPPIFKETSDDFLKSRIEEVFALFRSDHWRERLVWFIVVRSIPVIGSLIGAGWQLDLMHRDEGGGFPENRRIGYYLSDGLILWAVYAAWALIITLFLGLFGNFGTSLLDVLLQIIEGILAWLFTDSSFPSLGSILFENVGSLILDSIITLFAFMLMWLMYFGGVLRYALRRNKRVFIEVRKNLQLIWQYRAVLFYAALQYLIVIVFFTLLALILVSVPIIGIILIWLVIIPLKDMFVAKIQAQGMGLILPIDTFSIEDV